jgi:transposase
MRDRDLYAGILGIEAPWAVADVKLDQPGKKVEVFLDYQAKTAPCPECGVDCGRYDTRERRWRHLDTCQFQTILIAQVPRIDCRSHGVRQAKVPWAEPGSQFTSMFEALAIDWLKEASISAVAGLMGITWDEVDGIMGRAVRRGLARRQEYLPTSLTVDETSFQRRHEYVTVVSDRSGKCVVHVADGRGREVLSDFYAKFPKEDLAAIDTITMDMWAPYIEATRTAVPEAGAKIAFDKFHVAKHLGDGVDKVRREEHRELNKTGDDQLKGTKYFWLQNPANMTEHQRAAFDAIRGGNLRTARAWALKETAMQLWHYSSWDRAERAWNRWYGWAIRSRLEPMKRVARMVKSHLEGILNAVVTGATNAQAEGINAVIQWLKYTARGYRNRERFRNAIYFHLGGLDLYPAGVKR